MFKMIPEIKTEKYTDQEWPKITKNGGESPTISKNGLFWVTKWSNRSEKIASPVSNILSNFLFYDTSHNSLSNVP